jgi:hypothetical protein
MLLRDDVVGILPALLVERSGVRIPAGGAHFPFLQYVQTVSNLPSLLFNGYRIIPPEVKRPGRDADNTLPCSAKVTEWVCISFPS